MRENNKNLRIILTFAVFILVLALLYLAQNIFDDYKIRVLNLAAVYVVLGLGLNLINGITGLFSLGHAGFMMIGAYTAALLSMPLAAKEMNFYMKPLIAPAAAL
jgi:branched-chain amino acid transport system permease protein